MKNKGIKNPVFLSHFLFNHTSSMKRIHLFEFEDYPWFPNMLRTCMTRYIMAFHKLLGSAEELSELIARAFKHTKSHKVIDLCSGAGGPMLEVIQILRKKHGINDLQFTFTDLYPNLKAAKNINGNGDSNVTYLTEPVNASGLGKDNDGVRTMVCSMHHMKPDIARSILKDAQEARQPICVFEISDNSFPAWIWWIAFPINIITTLLLTPLVRPMTWQQLVFTYIIPILPICIAWDGAVSNARTYTLKDMDILLEGLESEHYQWEKDTIKGKAKKLYLLGLPIGA